jgi:hypothetical protein
MAKVEVALGDSGEASVWVSYDPKLVREAIEALEAHDATYRAVVLGVRGQEHLTRADVARTLRPLVRDPGRLQGPAQAYTLSSTRPTGPRLVLLAEDYVWTLVAADETEEAADREDNSQVEFLTDANFSDGAAMLRDFLRKAEADNEKAPRR